MQKNTIPTLLQINSPELEMLGQFQSLSASLQKWIDSNKKMAKGTSKKFNALICNISTFQAELDYLIEVSESNQDVEHVKTALKRASTANSQPLQTTHETSNDIQTHSNNEEDLEDMEANAQEMLMLRNRKNRKRKHRLRSRNPFVDALLEEEDDEFDDFADLEEFIVCKRGKIY